MPAPRNSPISWPDDWLHDSGRLALLFNSLVFLFLFLPITYAVFWSLRTANSRYIWLTITGYVFYGYWDARFCLLMAFSTVVSYTAGLGFLRFTTPRARLLCLVVPVTVDLLLLGFFKYANFVLENIAAVAQSFGWEFLDRRLDVILPVGISFYTFHTISYIVDCYRGTVKPTRNFFEFGAYVSLFSQLVAGPIVPLSTDRGGPGKPGHGGSQPLVGHRHLVLRLGSRGKGAGGRLSGRVCRSGLEGLCQPVDGRRLARRPGLQLPALFRFLRL